MLYHAGDNDLRGLQSAVDFSISDLQDLYKQKLISSLVVIGHSGVIVAIPVHLATGIPVVIVRKQIDECHAWQTIINLREIGTKPMFFDDLIDSGATKETVADAVKAETGEVIVGSYEYQHRKIRWDSAYPPFMTWTEIEERCDVCYRHPCDCHVDHGFGLDSCD